VRAHGSHMPRPDPDVHTYIVIEKRGIKECTNIWSKLVPMEVLVYLRGIRY
jgi:hypothetical protein